MSDGGTRRRTKVERVMDEYDLEGWGERLERAWTGEGRDRKSLRELAREFNVAVLRSAMESARGSVVPADVESSYETLTDDDTPRSTEIRKRRELERDGVDVERVESDFVTHQAIHTYLKRVREAEFTRDPGDRLERKRETVQRLASKTRVVTETTIEELVNAGELTDREYDVFVTVSTVCEDCGANYTIDEFLSQGGCDCER